MYEQDGTVYVRNEITVSQDDIVLEFGKSMISFRVKESFEGQISKCTYTGWNMMKAKEITGSAEVGEVSVKAGGGTSWADEARILPGMWGSVIDSQGVRDAEDARNRALGTLQNASMEWQRAEVRCEGDHRIRPGMRVTLKYVGERFSGERDRRGAGAAAQRRRDGRLFAGGRKESSNCESALGKRGRRDYHESPCGRRGDIVRGRARHR